MLIENLLHSSFRHSDQSLRLTFIVFVSIISSFQHRHYTAREHTRVLWKHSHILIKTEHSNPHQNADMRINMQKFSDMQFGIQLPWRFAVPSWNSICLTFYNVVPSATVHIKKLLKCFTVVLSWLYNTELTNEMNTRPGLHSARLNQPRNINSLKTATDK